jgi:hypothetical protein
MDSLKPKKEYKQMSLEKLRSFKGMENKTDEEAKQIIEQLEKFSVIAFELFQKHKAEQNE